MAVEPNILVILGPTASGKSALAMAVARRTKAEILSVDSMQVYRGMDIGTAKPSAAERAEVAHHLIDVAEPSESFTVARFVELAEAAIRDCARRQVPLIATGGTPLYYKALFEGLFQGPGADAELRQRLRSLAPEQLHARLREVDPDAAQRIHVNDSKRLVRALEVFELTGRPISSLQTTWGNSAPTRYPATWVGLNWPREALNQRINARVKSMVTAGWLEEVKGLLARYGSLSRTAGEATGYRQWIEHLDGRLSIADAIEQIKIATRQLARRQIKWFRRFSQVRWLQYDAPDADLESRVSQILNQWQSPTRENG